MANPPERRPSRRFQYQITTKPVATLVNPTQAAEAGSHQGWVDPIQLTTKVISTALIASQVISIVPPTTGQGQWDSVASEARWHQPWSEPQRQAPRTAWYQDLVQTPRVAPVVSTAVTVPQHSDTLPSATALFQYQAQALYPLPIPNAAATPTISYAALAEPVRTALRNTDNPQPAFTPIVQQDLVTSWYVPLSEPVRTKPIDAWFQDWTKGMQPVVSFSYYLPWQDPVRTPPRDVVFQETTKSTQPVVSFSYYEPLSEPVRTPPRDAWYQPDTIGRPNDTSVTGIKYLPLSEPVRTPARTAWYQDETLTQIVQQDTLASWYVPLSDPVRVALRDAWYQPTVLDPFPRPNVVTPTQFLSPLSEPVRQAARTPWYQDATALGPFPIPPPPVSTAITVPQLSDSLPATVVSFQYQARSTQPPVFSTAVTPAINYLPLSEPVRVAPRDAWFQDLALNPPFTAAPPISYPALSEPVRVPPRDVWFQPATVAEVQPVVSFSYYQPWSEPVRVKPTDAWFQPDTKGTPATDVTGIKYLALSEPQRAPLRDAWYQDYTANVFPLPNVTVPADSWLPYFDDFARPPQRVAWNQDLAYAAGAVVPVAITTLQSWEPWSEPVRLLPNISLYPPWQFIDSVDLVVDTGKVWPRYWMQYDPDHSINRDAPHDLVWADEDDVITVLLLS